ncbi:hypothetical protein Tco_1501026 [Tanacetum coccineum]
MAVVTAKCTLAVVAANQPPPMTVLNSQTHRCVFNKQPERPIWVTAVAPPKQTLLAGGLSPRQTPFWWAATGTNTPCGLFYKPNQRTLPGGLTRHPTHPFGAFSTKTNTLLGAEPRPLCRCGGGDGDAKMELKAAAEGGRDGGLVVMEWRRQQVVEARVCGDRVDRTIRTIFGFDRNARRKSFPAAAASWWPVAVAGWRRGGVAGK